MNPKMRKALMESGGRWRGTGRHGEATVTGEHVQSREQAGLCTCEEARK
jgi:hypothetical protein